MSLHDQFDLFTEKDIQKLSAEALRTWLRVFEQQRTGPIGHLRVRVANLWRRRQTQLRQAATDASQKL